MIKNQKPGVALIAITSLETLASHGLCRLAKRANFFAE